MTALLREGDIVGLTGKVKYDFHPEADADLNRVFVDVEGYHTTVLVKPEAVSLIAPRIDVGERVRWTNGNEGKVLASDVDKLWVKLDDGSYVIWPAKEVTVLAQKAADLDPVEPPPAPLDGKVGSEEEV